MRFVRNPSTDAHYNMAFDEYLLSRMPLPYPLFCLWQNAPAVIIGLNQCAYQEVDMAYLEQEGIALARRVTGGGAVYHDLGNLNYTIVGRIASLEHDYPQYLALVIDALRTLGVEAELSGRNDIMVHGHKVSGYAKRVWKDRVMIHGTLMYDVDLDHLTRALSLPGSKLATRGIASVRSRVANLRPLMPHVHTVGELSAALEEILSCHHRDGEVVLTQQQLDEVAESAQTRFATWQWNVGHSPDADINLSHRFACGTIGAHLHLRGGCIQALRFSGDFIGNSPTDTLVTALIGCPLRRDALTERLQGICVADYFDHLTYDELTDFLLS